MMEQDSFLGKNSEAHSGGSCSGNKLKMIVPARDPKQRSHITHVKTLFRGEFREFDPVGKSSVIQDLSRSALRSTLGEDVCELTIWTEDVLGHRSLEKISVSWECLLIDLEIGRSVAGVIRQKAPAK